MHCPDCVTEMIEDTKRLGYYRSKWMVCPDCGLRSEPDNESTYKADKITDSRKIRNASGGKINTETIEDDY